MANIHTLAPFSLSKNLGAAYNDAIRRFDADDWLIVKDTDVLFLTPDTARHIHEYTQRYPDAGLLTCYTNRVANREQLLGGRFLNIDNMRYHLSMAKIQERNLYQVKVLERPISGFVMVIKKATWDLVQFSENMKCLGVDNDYDERLRAAGFSILLMQGVYVWHTYRFLNGRRDVKHLH